MLRDGLERSGIVDNARLLVAISGGADSTALILGLREICSNPTNALQIEAAHFNHQLRGEISDRDEQVCRDLCTRLDIKLHEGTGDVAAHAAVTGESVESAARDLRYRFLAETVFEHDFNAVATGHTMDDQAETVLFSITRGAGLRGLSGMAYETERRDLGKDGEPLRVIRPMLGLRRSDTESFCETRNVTPQQDESNVDPVYARNRVRHNVIPELREINPGVVEAISRLATISSDDIKMIDELARTALEDATIDSGKGISKHALRTMAPALRTHVMAAAYQNAVGSMRDLDMAPLLAASEAVSEFDSGSIDLPNEVKLVVEHELVRFLVGDSDPGCPYPAEVGEHILRLLKIIEFSGGGTLAARISWPAPDPASLTRWQAIINPEVVEDKRLQVRARRDGDRFHPLGMANKIKLQDFFVNRHVPARWRDRVPLLLTDRGICWVVGERVAEWALVPDGASEAVLLEYIPPE